MTDAPAWLQFSLPDVSAYNVYYVKLIVEVDNVINRLHNPPHVPINPLLSVVMLLLSGGCIFTAFYKMLLLTLHNRAWRQLIRQTRSAHISR